MMMIKFLRNEAVASLVIGLLVVVFVRLGANGGSGGGSENPPRSGAGLLYLAKVWVIAAVAVYLAIYAWTTPSVAEDGVEDMLRYMDAGEPDF
jgi:hypothetical protein